MDAETALVVIRPLADGVDPLSGEELPAESLYQNPQVVRALTAAVSALENERSRMRRQERLPKNAGLPWSSEEDDSLARSFDEQKSLGELAALHHRSAAAIKARLIKLGKLAPD